MIRLEFEDNDRCHDDLVLRYPGGEFRGDTYYLALDKMLAPDDESLAKIRAVLTRLLRHWHQLVRDAGESDSVLLPFALFDEGTQAIRCTCKDELVDLEIADCAVLGHTFCPSDLTTFFQMRPVFSQYYVIGPFRMSRVELLAAIEANAREYEAT